jgi:tetraacyldisaccharide 4'-kinase
MHIPDSLHPIGSTEIFGLELVEGKNVLAVCGIGNPDSFVSILRTLKATQITLLDFPDHHKYSLADIKLILSKAEVGGVDFIITTEKDEQKLLAFHGFPIFVLSIKLHLTTREDLLATLLLRIPDSH